MQSCVLQSAAAPVHARPVFLQRLQQLGNCKLVQPSQRNVVAHGILDSFRKERGLPIPGQQGSSTQTIEEPQPRVQPGKQQRSAADDEECPVECVTEVYTPEEFEQALAAAGPRALVVVDFFKSACGACKFIYPGFVKMCRESTTHQQQQQQQEDNSQPVVFLKHNVYDDDEGEVTQLCKQYNVRSVPKFIFFKDGQQLESFSTRDKAKVAEAILKYAEPGSVEFGDWVTGPVEE